MLKPPIILPIVPSKYWLLAQCGLLIGVVVLSYWVGGKLAAGAMVVLGAAFGWRGYLRQPKGVLSLTSMGSHFQGRWLRDSQSAEAGLTQHEVQGEAHQVHCDYLGPWLIGLYVGKQRVWLWPDSAPQKSLRETRKLFHRPGR
ncbi:MULTISPECIES: hypothetical protein [Halomonadaceae]|uniref:hypothetical protein n=1 Tax=Halomonadaceae TaxID=28256 RepID=UPI0005FC9A85|nr:MULTISPECIES: hypothetical protein [Halomonas]CEP35546.1 Putative uncharacterized protein [Halomonas sp. R57-5]